MSSFLYHRLRWDSPGGVQTSATNDYGVDTWGNDFVKLDYGVAKLTSLLVSEHQQRVAVPVQPRAGRRDASSRTARTRLANLVGAGGNVPGGGVGHERICQHRIAVLLVPQGAAG